MTLVTEGGREMNREEKKEWLKKHKDKIKLKLECISLSCYGCPYNNNSVIAGCEEGEIKKERDDLMLEVLAEEHGYVKEEEIKNWLTPRVVNFISTDDPVNPDHYKTGKLQVIEQMLITYGVNAVSSFCKLNVYKYHARAGLKGDASMDHKKADWYMRLYDRLKSFGSMDSEKALEALRAFLKEENGNAANH